MLRPDRESFVNLDLDILSFGMTAEVGRCRRFFCLRCRGLSRSLAFCTDTWARRILSSLALALDLEVLDRSLHCPF